MPHERELLHAPALAFSGEVCGAKGRTLQAHACGLAQDCGEKGISPPCLEQFVVQNRGW